MLRTRTDGFSLIELMIVAGLIAVLAGMAAPTIVAGMRVYPVISASQQVVGTIRTARNQAVGKNVILRVRFNSPAVGQYRIVDTAGAVVGGVHFLPDGADFGAVSSDIEIDTSGRMSPFGAGAMPATIVLTNGTQNRTITVSASGRVQLP